MKPNVTVQEAALALVKCLDNARIEGDSSPETSATFDSGWGVVEAIDALKQAIALPATVEAVAWAGFNCHGTRVALNAEKVVVDLDTGLEEKYYPQHAPYRVVPLYAAPPAQAGREAAVTAALLAVDAAHIDRACAEFGLLAESKLLYALHDALAASRGGS